jgi:capsular polysaccharide biosynthesis protein
MTLVSLTKVTFVETCSFILTLKEKPSGSSLVKPRPSIVILIGFVAPVKNSFGYILFTTTSR